MDVGIQQMLMQQQVANRSHEKTSTTKESENSFGQMLEEKTEPEKGSVEKEITPEMLTPLWVNIQQIPKPTIQEVDESLLYQKEGFELEGLEGVTMNANALENEKWRRKMETEESTSKVETASLDTAKVKEEQLKVGEQAQMTEQSILAVENDNGKGATQTAEATSKVAKDSMTEEQLVGEESNSRADGLVKEGVTIAQKPMITPQSVSQTAMTESVIKPEYMEQIKQNIAENLADGNTEFEIQLNPKHLGELIIKATYEGGKAIVSIVCKESEALQAMARNSTDLANILELKLGQETQVVVESPRSDYLQQENQKEQNNQQQQKQEEQRSTEELRENSDFLQQLRLGIA